MKTSLKGLIEIASHEGIITSAYLDSVGVWTVGIGHTAAADGGVDPAKDKREFTIPEVFALFEKDIAKYEKRVNDAVKVPLQQHEFDALVSFDYNTGGIYKAKLTKLLNAGDRKGATAGFMGWLKPPEIKGRRTKEMNLFSSGVYTANGYATAYRADKNGKVLWSTAKKINVAEYLKAVEPSPVVNVPPVELNLEDTETVITIRKSDLSNITLGQFLDALSILKGA